MRNSLVLALLCAGSLSAVTVTLHTSNSGIGSMNFSVVGNTINIDETWTGTGPGALLIGDLDASITYTVIKTVTNNSGIGWTRFANELLDPAGQANDADDPLPYPAYVPAGFTTSNDGDGLSFDQGGGVVRTSSVYPSFVADELTDARDFLDFFGATLANGGVATIQFGLIAGGTANQPFLLLQRPNEDSRTTVPEPATYALIGSALLALASFRRRR